MDTNTNANANANACARFDARLHKAGIEPSKGLATSFSERIQKVVSVDDARVCAVAITDALPQPPRMDIALEAIAAFHAARNWATFKASLVQSPKAVKSRQEGMENVLHLLLPRGPDRTLNASWVYYHPGDQDYESRKIVVGIHDNWNGFDVEVCYREGLHTFSLESVFEDGCTGHAEVMRKIYVHANRMAAKWMYPHDAVPPFTDLYSEIDLLEENGFHIHNTGGNVMAWRAEHGGAECLLSSTANSLHIWKREPMLVTIFPDSTQSSWENAQTKEMSLDEAIALWHSVIASKAEVMLPTP